MRAVRGGILRFLASSSRVSGRSASFSNNPKSFAANKCLLIMKPAAVWRMRSGVVSFIWGLALPYRAIPACAKGNKGEDLRQLAGKAQLLQSLQLELVTYNLLPLFTSCREGSFSEPQLATPSDVPSSCKPGTPLRRCVADNAPRARSPHAGLRTAPAARGGWPTKRFEEWLSRRRASLERGSRGCGCSGTARPGRG